MPRMTTAERDAIPGPANGLMIYNTDDGFPRVWSDASGTPKWDSVLTTGSNAGWLIKGNVGLIDGTDNFFGTLDGVPVRVITNNTERMRIEADGDFGINTTTPGAKLDVLHSLATGTSAAVRGQSNSLDANAVAVHGIISSTTPGGFSAAVRGTNNGTGGIGIGVCGEQTGFGWGLYGTTPGGIGVHGNSANGFGVYGLSTTGTGVYGLSTSGESGRFDITNNANASNALSGITSAGGNALWGITSSISAAGVIGDNTFGEAVVGRNRGGYGVGAVVGRNDSSGYGVRGFNTKDGIGVLGQAGISGGTGVGGRFENVNAANGNDALQAATTGTGWAANFTNANNSSASRALRVSTTASQGGNAVTIANGTLSLSRQNPYASNTVVDDAILVVTTAGNVTVLTGPPLVDGATVWVVNNAGAVVTVTNTTVGAFDINPGRAVQLLFVSTVSGANWIPVQP